MKLLSLLSLLSTILKIYLISLISLINCDVFYFTNCYQCNGQPCITNITNNTLFNKYPCGIAGNLTCVCNNDKCGLDCGNDMITGKQIKDCVKKVFCDLDRFSKYLILCEIMFYVIITIGGLLMIFSVVQYVKYKFFQNNSYDQNDQNNPENIPHGLPEIYGAENTNSTLEELLKKSKSKNLLMRCIKSNYFIPIIMFSIVVIASVMYAVFYTLLNNYATQFDDNLKYCV